MDNHEGKFKVGDMVEKFTGDYQISGEVRSVFTTRAGKIRYVVEHQPGFLHIYNESNLRQDGWVDPKWEQINAPDWLNSISATIRLRKAVQRLGAQISVAQLARTKQAELMALKNFGWSTLRELNHILSEHGIKTISI